MQNEALAEIMRQCDASFALEGFQQTPLRKAMNDAILEGRVGLEEAHEELFAWVREHKSTDGFFESRSWLW